MTQPEVPRWKRWRDRNPDLYRERQRLLMRQRRADRSDNPPSADVPVDTGGGPDD